MGAAGSEQTILKKVAELQRATKFQLHQQTGLSLDYVDYLCKALVREGYIRLLGQGGYALARKGKKLLLSLGYDVGFDEATLKELAGQVAKEVARVIKTEDATREITREIIRERGPSLEAEEERKKIEIRTDHVFSVADETVGLETNIGKIGAAVEKERGKSLDASVKLLKRLKKPKENK